MGMVNTTGFWSQRCQQVTLASMSTRWKSPMTYSYLTRTCQKFWTDTRTRCTEQSPCEFEGGGDSVQGSQKERGGRVRSVRDGDSQCKYEWTREGTSGTGGRAGRGDERDGGMSGTSGDERDEIRAKRETKPFEAARRGEGTTSEVGRSARAAGLTQTEFTLR
ncbi:hypothetical protein EDB89DRAFT_1900231 [Lactarius sanguifluus]|nr:hypothetical protein EDB89DRAFT_1900231 [Lactarius sanguifluus]